MDEDNWLSEKLIDERQVRRWELLSRVLALVTFALACLGLLFDTGILARTDTPEEAQTLRLSLILGLIAWIGSTVAGIVGLGFRDKAVKARKRLAYDLALAFVPVLILVMLGWLVIIVFMTYVRLVSWA